MRLSQISRNHTSDMGLNIQRVFISLVMVATSALVPAGVLYAQEAGQPKKASVAKVSADPLAKDIWHAVGDTWPGTLKFTAKGKKVELAPLGAQALQATYEVTGLKTNGGLKEGRLKMKDAEGREVLATFTIQGDKNLALRFNGGQRTETYVRMTPAEEEAELVKLKKMMEQRAKTSPIR